MSRSRGPILALCVTFLLGFFLDWIEISLIILPLVAPVVQNLGFDLVWFTVLFAVCLQTSFLTPPVGFAIFYLKGVAPESIDIRTIYKGEPNHLITTDVAKMQLPSSVDTQPLEGRSMLVKKTDVVPIECVVRGYLIGSGWKEYQASSSVCGIELPAGLAQAEQLEEPIFTPATKADEGHDENISLQQMCTTVGTDVANELRERSLDIYRRGAEMAAKRGIIIADTKFEWGRLDDELILIDEVLTPDSSRFWPADEYEMGRNPPSFDKQFVRDWLETTDWDKNSEPPALPDEIVQKTREKYIEAYERITGDDFPWK